MTPDFGSSDALGNVEGVIQVPQWPAKKEEAATKRKRKRANRGAGLEEPRDEVILSHTEAESADSDREERPAPPAKTKGLKVDITV